MMNSSFSEMISEQDLLTTANYILEGAKRPVKLSTQLFEH